MNTDKLMQVVAFILKRNNGSMDYYNLIKECYIADRRSIDAIGNAITGDSYVSMNRGPVLKGLYTFIKDKNENVNDQKKWNSCFSVKDHKISLLDTAISDAYLSDFEENILGSVSDQFYGYSYEDMKKYAHADSRFPEWTPVEKGEEIPLPLENVMKAVGISDKEIELLIAEKKVFEEEASLFHTH
ncbi:DUF4065 domain-containing protein [Treponema ruminis]|uniref:Antitoxin SocA-like Panacea domain-containing protein n=1 Tax=Treponema ruminis TaxID=744515 RepID=A0A7W8LMJ7_9SPIR|nr:Panacea domain-containing protein [Treponema ruminis]MBB5226594.1 hypothetical protein [Treponema ruminis]QSI02176.1 DUF4065 domain-containing protein [Treponema ruminis]